MDLSTTDNLQDSVTRPLFSHKVTKLILLNDKFDPKGILIIDDAKYKQMSPSLH